MDTTADSEPRTYGFVKKAVGVFIASVVLYALPLVAALFTDLQRTQDALQPLHAFSPATISDLLSDASSQCIAPGPHGEPPEENLLSLSVPCRAKPIIDGWPSVGHWAHWVNSKSSVFGFLTAYIVIADVTVHLVIAPSATAVVLGLAQLILGFKICLAIFSRSQPAAQGDGLDALAFSRRLLLLTLCALFVGALMLWVMLYAFDLFLSGLRIVIHWPLVAEALAIAMPYAAANAFLAVIAKKSFEKATESASETLVEKIMRRLKPYLP